MLSIHEKVWSKAHGQIVSTVVHVYHCPYAVHPIRVLLWRKHPQHMNQAGIECLILAICLGMIWPCSELLSTGYPTEVGNELALKIALLVRQNLLWQTVVDDKVVPQCFGCCLGSWGLVIYACVYLVKWSVINRMFSFLSFPSSRHREVM